MGKWLNLTIKKQVLLLCAILLFLPQGADLWMTLAYATEVKTYPQYTFENLETTVVYDCVVDDQGMVSMTGSDPRIHFWTGAGRPEYIMDIRVTLETPTETVGKLKVYWEDGVGAGFSEERILEDALTPEETVVSWEVGESLGGARLDFESVVGDPATIQIEKIEMNTLPREALWALCAEMLLCNLGAAALIVGTLLFVRCRKEGEYRGFLLRGMAAGLLYTFVFKAFMEDAFSIGLKVLFGVLFAVLTAWIGLMEVEE